MTVHFTDVGRDKQTWDVEVKSLSDSVLMREIRVKRALHSRDVEFVWDETGIQATIWVGGFRKVGRLAVEGGYRLCL